MNTRAKNVRSTIRVSAPVWVGDEVIGLNLMPNGSLLTDVTGITPQADGRLYLPSGTLLGRSYAERTAGDGFGIADVASDDEMWLLLYDIYDVNDNNEVQFYRHNRLVYENFLPNLPDGTLLDGSPVQATIRSLYECWYGAN